MRFVATETNEPRRESIGIQQGNQDFSESSPWFFYELGTAENSRVSASLSYVWD